MTDPFAAWQQLGTQEWKDGSRRQSTARHLSTTQAPGLNTSISGGGNAPLLARRSSVATALAVGTLDNTAWSRGTVPEHMELIVLTDEELANSPIAYTSPQGKGAAPPVDLPPLVPSPRITSTRGTSRRNTNANSNGGPGAPGRKRSPQGKKGGKGKASAGSDANGMDAWVRDAVVVPRCVAEQIASLRLVGPPVATVGAALGAVTSTFDGPSASSARGMASASTPTSALPGTAAFPVPVPSANMPTTAAPPKVLPTVRVFVDRHATEQWTSSGPLGHIRISSPRNAGAGDSLAWYRTELAMLREQVGATSYAS